MRILQWCRNNGVNEANLFVLWSGQFEKEFGLEAQRQSHMLSETRPIVYHPYSDKWSTPWLLSLNSSSIHSLVYEHELYHPLLRVWRCYEPNDPLIPRDPWARFRGYGFPPLKRPSGEVLQVRNPSLPWNNGWQGMPPFLWQRWLETKHTIHIREALEQLEAESQKKLSNKFPKSTIDNKEGEEVERKWAILQNGKEMPTLIEMRSSLKSLSNQEKPGPQIKLNSQDKNKQKTNPGISMNPLTVDGQVESDDRGRKPVNATGSHSNPANTSSNNAMMKPLGHGTVSSKQPLNPTVPEFRSLSPQKPITKTKSPSVKLEEAGVKVQGGEESTLSESPEEPSIKTSATKETMPSKTLATSAKVDKSLGVGGISASSTTTSESSLSTINSNDNDIYSRWKSAEEAYCASVRDEMDADKSRKRKIVELRVMLAVAEREDDEAAKAAIARVAAQQKKIESLRAEMKEKGSNELKERVQKEDGRDRVEALALLERDRIVEANTAAAASTVASGSGGGGGGGAEGKTGKGNGGKKFSKGGKGGKK